MNPNPLLLAANCRKSSPGHTWISWKSAATEDQELKDLIEKLNRSIVESAS